MKYLTTLALLATTTTAVPVEKLFNLVTSNASNTAHNGLYVGTQADGPLNSNAILGSAATAATFYLDNGALHYEAPNGAPWEMALVRSQSVKGPVEVSVSPTTGSEGFGLDGDGRLVASGKTFGGWLGKLVFGLFISDIALVESTVADFSVVCDAAGNPSLDYINTAVGSGVPAGCEEVQLKAAVKTSPKMV